MDMVTRQDTLQDVHAHFFARLHDDLTNTIAHGPLQNLVAIFCGPHDVKPVVKSRMSGFGIAEADRLKAGGLNPLGGK